MSTILTRTKRTTLPPMTRFTLTQACGCEATHYYRTPEEREKLTAEFSARRCWRHPDPAAERQAKRSFNHQADGYPESRFKCEEPFCEATFDHAHLDESRRAFHGDGICADCQEQRRADEAANGPAPDACGLCGAAVFKPYGEAKLRKNELPRCSECDRTSRIPATFGRPSRRVAA